MSIGEFEEVGEVIKSFTSEDATVVVGTVIDPEMKEKFTCYSSSNRPWKQMTNVKRETLNQY